MAKLVIVCVIAMLAVASAAFTLDAFKPMEKMQEEAMTCPTNTCVVSGGDCVSTTTDYKYCPQYETYNETTVSGVSTCNCAAISKYLAIGVQCYPTAVFDQCGPYATCSVAAGGSSADYKCYGKKMIGDTCTVGSYECALPRVCSSSGKCVANLAAGALCYNATTFLSLGRCPVSQFCPTGVTGDQICTDFLAVGAACSTAGTKCPPYTQCGLMSSSSAPTCDRPVFATLAAGVDANVNLGAYSCASYLMNATSGKCVDYATELAKWNAAFPSPSTMTTCTYSTDCNLPGVTLASCLCTAKATGSTPYCLLRPEPSVLLAGQVGLYKTDGVIETGFKAGCENPVTSFESASSAYCASNWQSAFLAAVCPAVSASAGAGFSCFDESYGLCNGASALQSSVVMTMIVALVAFFTTQ
jgi:hypothetical protein